LEWSAAHFDIAEDKDGPPTSPSMR
jgi:hypothetical protein